MTTVGCPSCIPLRRHGRAPPSRKRARANISAGVSLERSVRRAARGQCLWVWVLGGAGALPVPHRGGAERARPGSRRMLSGIRQAAPCRPRSRLFACPSSGPSARVAPAAIRTDRGTCVWRGFRHGPWQAASGPPCPPQARPGQPAPRPPCGQTRNGIRPGGWLSTGFLGCLSRETPMPPAEPRWPPPPEASRATSARPAPGIPSRLARNVRDPSGSGSAGNYGMGVEGVEKEGGVGMGILSLI